MEKDIRMNNKVQIWKRKLAKEQHKQQMRMWDRLKYEQTFNSEIPRFSSAWTMGSTDFSFKIEDGVAADLAKMLTDEIDKEILQSLTNDKTS